MYITIEELYKLKQDNKNIDDLFLSIDKEKNLNFIKNRICKIEEYPQDKNIDAENYFMNTFCCEEKIGSNFFSIKKWYQTALNYIKYHNNEYDIKTLIKEYEYLTKEYKGSEIYFALLTKLYFYEYLDTNEPSRLEDIYKNLLNQEHNGYHIPYAFAIFYELMKETGLNTPICNPQQLLVDLWNYSQNLYQIKNCLKIDIEELRFELKKVKDKLIFKDENAKENFENAYDYDDDDWY